MPAAQELLVDAFMAGTAVAGCEADADDETVMIDFLLTGRRLMAVQTIDTLLCVCGHFVFMNDRVLQARMTLGTFARRSDKIGGGLIGFHLGPCPIDQEGGENERKGNNDGNKYGAKRHALVPQREELWSERRLEITVFRLQGTAMKLYQPRPIVRS
jgi:hypothetical protein